MRNGLFIAVEGDDGVGKSTIIKRVVESILNDSRFDEYSGLVTTREVGGSPVAEQIRSDIMYSDKYPKDIHRNTLFSLISAARVDHYENTIYPNIQNNKIVISDRYEASTYVYQCVDYSQILNMRQALGYALPDIYVYITSSTAHKLERKYSREVSIDKLDITEGMDKSEAISIMNERHKRYCTYFNMIRSDDRHLTKVIEVSNDDIRDMDKVVSSVVNNIAKIALR